MLTSTLPGKSPAVEGVRGFDRDRKEELHENNLSIDFNDPQCRDLSDAVCVPGKRGLRRFVRPEWAIHLCATSWERTPARCADGSKPRGAQRVERVNRWVLEISIDLGRERHPQPLHSGWRVTRLRIYPMAQRWNRNTEFRGCPGRRRLFGRMGTDRISDIRAQPFSDRVRLAYRRSRQLYQHPSAGHGISQRRRLHWDFYRERLRFEGQPSRPSDGKRGGDPYDRGFDVPKRGPQQLNRYVSRSRLSIATAEPRLEETVDEWRRTTSPLLRITWRLGCRTSCSSSLKTRAMSIRDLRICMRWRAPLLLAISPRPGYLSFAGWRETARPRRRMYIKGNATEASKACGRCQAFSATGAPHRSS